jgi:hypothetical protein
MATPPKATTIAPIPIINPLKIFQLMDDLKHIRLAQIVNCRVSKLPGILRHEFFNRIESFP